MADSANVPIKARPSGLMRQLLKVPLRLYRLGLAGRLGRSFLVLTTRGRRTGRLHTVALDYLRDGDRIYVFAGYGKDTDWYRNALVQPEVEVRIGDRYLQAKARPIQDIDERRRLLGLLQRQARDGTHGPPRPVRFALKYLGMDYDAELARSAARAERIPAVEIVPCHELPQNRPVAGY